jgi:SAM-dependent methyltransferase
LVTRITSLVFRLNKRFRHNRGDIFLRAFPLGPQTKILDLGCGDGSNIADIIKDSPISPRNVYVADILPTVQKVAERYGYTPVLIPESGRLPFPDKFFDIVFCSSVIQYVSVAQGRQRRLHPGAHLEKKAALSQFAFASEIQRLGRSYFVQTPNKWFPIESHTWLPFLGWLPRCMLSPVLHVSNRIWIKKTIPTWNLLTQAQVHQLFPEATIQLEKVLHLTKSIMAIKKEQR